MLRIRITLLAAGLAWIRFQIKTSINNGFQNVDVITKMLFFSFFSLEESRAAKRFAKKHANNFHDIYCIVYLIRTNLLVSVPDP